MSCPCKWRDGGPVCITWSNCFYRLGFIAVSMVFASSRHLKHQSGSVQSFWIQVSQPWSDMLALVKTDGFWRNNFTICQVEQT
jgi:hypothetical protein